MIPSQTTRTPSSLPVSVMSGESRPLSLIALWFVAVAIASGIWWNVPLIDDWTYAWSVERFLNTGRFEVLDWTGNFAFGQVIWGAAWSSILGFSFVALRLSTLVMGAVTCAALYVMLRDFEIHRPVALTGALTLATNPAFVVLSASFMTDVPFTACATLSLLCYVRAAKFGRAGCLWWAGVWAFAAFTVRQVGIVVPLAGVPLLLIRRRSRTVNRLMVTAALGVTWGAMGVLWLALDALVGSTPVMSQWVDRLRNVFLVRPASYLAYNLALVTVLAFYLLPALLAAATIRGIWRSRTLAAASMLASVLLIAVLGELPLPLPRSETWNLREIGASRALVEGSMMPEPNWLRLMVRVAGLVAVTLLVAPLLKSFAPSHRLVVGFMKRGARAVPSGWARAASPRMCLLAFTLGYTAIINLLWLYNDRYYLALIPPLVALILAGLPEARVVPRLAWATLVAFAAIALVGSRDAFRFNLAVREAWETLVRDGAAPSDIDAGYAWNGWTLYAHPENLANGLNAERDVPWINSSRHAKYILSKTYEKGYDVMRVIDWTDLPWPGPDRLFVLVRQPETGDK